MYHFGPHAGVNRLADAFDDGLGVHLLADFLGQFCQPFCRRFAFLLGGQTKSCRFLAKIVQVHAACFYVLRQQADFFPHFFQRHQRALVRFADCLRDALGVIGVHVEQQKQLGEKLGCIAVGKTIIDAAGEFAFVRRIRGQHFLKERRAVGHWCLLLREIDLGPAPRSRRFAQSGRGLSA